MQESTNPTYTPVPADHPMFLTYAKAADAGNEELLTFEIMQLWEMHRGMQCSVKERKKEIRALGKTIGEALCCMKRLLARPGRNGGWSAFLKSQSIPRTTADRLVAAYEHSLNPEPNCTDGAIPESNDAAVRRLFAAVWPRLRRVLTSRQALDLFVGQLTAAYEQAAADKAAEEVAASVPGRDAASQPVDESMIPAPETISAPLPEPAAAARPQSAGEII
jgi:hypothetical protein